MAGVNEMKYINHSGGAEGSDMAWEVAGISYGVLTIAYSFPGHTQYGANPYIMDTDELNEGWKACEIAAKTLRRPLNKVKTNYVKNLFCRNWFQVKYADAIFAIGTMVNGSNKLVTGGTGWAVQMAVDNEKQVYLFEQNKLKWMEYNTLHKEFFECDIPTLTPDFAGIGTRKITDDGLQAILNVYESTFK
jgi:hypothetical protein